MFMKMADIKVAQIPPGDRSSASKRDDTSSDSDSSSDICRGR